MEALTSAIELADVRGMNFFGRVERGDLKCKRKLWLWAGGFASAWYVPFRTGIAINPESPPCHVGYFLQLLFADGPHSKPLRQWIYSIDGTFEEVSLDLTRCNSMDLMQNSI